MILIKKPFQLDLIFMPLKRQIAVVIKRKKKKEKDGLLIPESFNPQWLVSQARDNFPTAQKKCWDFFFFPVSSQQKDQ